jgi:cell division protein FtsI (penicillin-binding protein 3)
VKRGLEPAFISWRFYLSIALLLLIVAGLLFRVVNLTFFKRDFLRQQGNERFVRTVTVPAFRGMIKDRNGYPLAISTSVYSIWINPKEFDVRKNNIKLLSQKFGLKEKTIQAVIEKARKKGREFVYIKRDVAPETAKQIKSLKLLGVYLQPSFKRYYPEGEVMAHVVGFTNIDDQGQEGLELLYNQWLSGAPGKKLVIKDRIGRVISELETLRQQKPGNDITLSVDHRIQYLAYRELLEGVTKNVAESGSVIVMDVKTGEVLAMVNQPSFNPNQSQGLKMDTIRNRAVTDVFEPGSTMKAFSVAAALQNGHFKPDTLIDTSPLWVGRKLLQDEHKKGPLTVTEVLQYSSNVGVTKMVLTLPPESLWRLLSKVGFGEPTGIEFPGERAGVLINHPVWSSLALATLGFGYGMSVTTLQLAQAYSVIANAGEKKYFSLLKVDHPVTGPLVMEPKLAKEMLGLLEAVVSKGGTGEAAQISGYRVAGKTGTSKKVGEGGYEKQYVSSFVGIAPVTNPRLIIAVVINNPRKQYYAATVSAPIFKNIMEGALRILNIKPDRAEAVST